jgi:hypothetical protein
VGTTLTVTRGYNGTTALSQPLGATVRHVAVAMDFQEANDHVNNTTTAHGLTVANVLTTSNTKTVTNKTIDGGSNTLSNIPQSAVTSLVTDLAAKIAKSLVTAKGSIIAATGSSTPAELAVGANGKVLTADSSQATGLKWGSPGMVLVGTSSPSSSSGFSIDNCFSSSYRRYRIEVYLTAAAGSPTLSMKLRVGGADAATNYNYSVVIDNPPAPASSLTTGQSSFPVGPMSTTGAWITIDLFNPAHAVATGVHTRHVYGAASPAQGWYGGTHNTATAYDGFTLTPSASTVTGEIRVYAFSDV